MAAEKSASSASERVGIREKWESRGSAAKEIKWRRRRLSHVYVGSDDERALLGEVHSQRANSFKGYETSERERATACEAGVC